MGLPILVIGYSGSGKSTSMRNFDADELALVNVNGKPLPFRTKFSSVLNSDDYARIKDFIRSCGKKAVAVDDCQYLMVNEFMHRAKEKGYDKFNDIGKNMWELIRFVEELPNDVIVYFLGHIDTDDNGREKFKTIGKLLDEKVNIEGMFTTVLKTVASNGKYMFSTQTSGADTVKSPMGLFEAQYIDNDLKAVDGALRIYYHLAPEHTCTDCGKPIMPASGRTAQQIVDGSIKAFGRKLCINCVLAETKKRKEAAANTNAS